MPNQPPTADIKKQIEIAAAGDRSSTPKGFRGPIGEDEYNRALKDIGTVTGTQPGHLPALTRS